MMMMTTMMNGKDVKSALKAGFTKNYIGGGRGGKRQVKKVCFNGGVKVESTFAPEDYDRTPLSVDPMSAYDYHEFYQMQYDMYQAMKTEIWLRQMGMDGVAASYVRFGMEEQTLTTTRTHSSNHASQPMISPNVVSPTIIQTPILTQPTPVYAQPQVQHVASVSITRPEDYFVSSSFGVQTNVPTFITRPEDYFVSSSWGIQTNVPTAAC